MVKHREDTGSLPVSERFNRIESEQDEIWKTINGPAGLWKEIGSMKITQAKDSTRVAILVGMLAVLGQFLLHFLFK